MKINKTIVTFARGFSKEPDFDKFNTCAHRSGPQQYVVKGCCQTTTETGYVCIKLNIKGLAANHCNGCEVYSPKEEIQEKTLHELAAENGLANEV